LKYWEDKNQKFGFKAANFEPEKLKRYRYWKWAEKQEEEQKEVKPLKDVPESELAGIGFPHEANVVGAKTQKLLHYTFIFQAFVFCQLFNQLNARKLEPDEFNIFDGLLRNPLFIGVVVFTFVIQMVIVEIGGRITKTYPLNQDQNLFCVAWGSGELLWGIFIKFLPLKLFQCYSLDETPQEDDAAPTASQFLKKSATLKGIKD